MDIEHLVTMANDIAAFFHKAADQDEATHSVAGHLHRYWDPRMRKQIIEHERSGGAGMSELARNAVQLIAQEQSEVR